MQDSTAFDAICGDNPTVTELIDYEAFCGMPAVEPSEATVQVS